MFSNSMFSEPLLLKNLFLLDLETMLEKRARILTGTCENICLLASSDPYKESRLCDTNNMIQIPPEMFFMLNHRPFCVFGSIFQYAQGYAVHVLSQLG